MYTAYLKMPISKYIYIYTVYNRRRYVCIVSIQHTVMFTDKRIVYARVYIYMCVYVYISIYMYDMVCVCECMCKCMYGWRHVWVAFACMLEQKLYAFVYIHTYIHSNGINNEYTYEFTINK